MTNRMAHHYDTLFKAMFYREFPKVEELAEKEKSRILHRVKDLYVSDDSELVEKAIKELKKYEKTIFKNKKIEDIKEELAYKYCADSNRWFFKEKKRYTEIILKELQKDDRGINYGIYRGEDGKKSLVFDVPKFGQFSIHVGKNANEIFEEYEQEYGVKEFKGLYLGDVIILNKVHKSKVKSETEYTGSLADNFRTPEELEYKRKEFNYRRRIATQELREPIDKLENIEQENNLEEIEEDVPDNTQIEQKEELQNEGEGKIQKENIQEIDIERKEKLEKLEELIASSKNQEEARKMVEILEDVGIRPEDVLKKTAIDHGNSEAVKTIIEVITDHTTGLEAEALYNSARLLSVSKPQAEEIRLIIEEIKKLGIDYNIINEHPDFLSIAKAERIEPIYNTLKQYEIDITNKNIARAFEGKSENIKANMNLVIENGLYYAAKEGVDKFFTIKNDNLNMRINLLNKQKEPLVGKRAKINSKMFLNEKDLLKRFGITKKQVLKELSKIQGQELIQDSEYYAEQTTNQIELTEKQQEISKNICAKLDNNQTVDGVVMQIGEYYYSVPKVKEQVDSIIYNYNIQTLENIDVSEILKIALLKNKNITQEEVEKTSEHLQNMLKEEPEIQQAETEQLQQEEIIPDKLETEEELEQEEIQEEELEQEEIQEEELEEQEENTIFEKLQEKTKEVQEKREFFEGTKNIIKNLELRKEKLKKEQRELEEKLDSKILEESNEEIIESIKEIRANLQKCINTRKKVKSMIKTYKQHKKEAKAELKKSEKERESLLDELEL